jgi:nicotinate-nucleotide adenylyltransferase
MAERTGIGVLGGAFNPPHRSHERLAAAALARLPIAELRVIPAGDHPWKRDTDMAPAADRVAMCRLAFGHVRGVIVDDREVRRSGPSFTVDTLAELAAEAPGRRLFLLIGSDNLGQIASWHDSGRLLQLGTVVTYPRAGHPAGARALAGQPLAPAQRDALLANVLDVPADAVSASDIRARWRAGERELPELHPAVRDYIAAHGLYA